MNVVIVGGGFGGVKTALELAGKKDVRITLVTQHENFEYHGALYRSATGHSPKEVVIPLAEILGGKKNIRVILDTATKIDADDRLVWGEMGESYRYDFLVLAMGNSVNYFGIDGMEAHSYHMDTIGSTLNLRTQMISLFKRSSKRPAKIVVIGAGPSGVELSGEIKTFAKRVAERFKVEPRSVEVTLVEGADRILPNLSEAASKKAAKRLRTLGVKLRLRTKVESCEVGKVCISGDDLKADLIVWTAGSSPVQFYAQHPDVFELDHGRVKVDKCLRAVNQPYIYVIGDNAATKYSGMAQTALRDAQFVAADILANHRGKNHEDYRPKPPIYVVPVGPNWAIYQKGDTVRSGTFGWAVRRRADLEIFEAFEPYKKAIKLWQQGNKMSTII